MSSFGVLGSTGIYLLPVIIELDNFFLCILFGNDGELLLFNVALIIPQVLSELLSPMFELSCLVRLTENDLERDRSFVKVAEEGRGGEGEGEGEEEGK